MREPNSWLASITASLEDALRAIQTGEEPFVSEDSVRHAMATMDAIYLSLRQGRRVEVGQAE
jgi:predicted dehydrogenase